MDIGICSIIASTITGVCSIITAIIWGYVPRKKNHEYKRMIKELIEVYQGAYNLIAVEENLESESGVSKIEARKGLVISDRLQRKKIEKRINELESKIS